ncbi:MAG: DUF2807 domain-containing protein [Dehalococcoidales bacterium]|nr:MAG: DUF2807 domain-containing protein [Dehalococcoidales bacterium]
MEYIEELQREAEGVKEKVTRDIDEIRDILKKIAGEARDRGEIRAARMAQKAEKRIDGITERIEDRIERTLLMMTKWMIAPEARSEIDGGSVVTRNIDLSDFTNIEIDSNCRIEIVYSDTYRVTLTTGEKLFEHIDVIKSGNTLRVSLKPCLFRFRPRTMEVHIEMPTINKLRLAAAARGIVHGFCSQESFDVNLSGASRLDIDVEAGNSRLEISGASRLTGNMKVNDAEFTLSGASRVELQGSAKTVVLNAWGASHLNLADFVIDDTNIHLEGASQATINTRGNLDIDLSGASGLSYTGNPRLRDIKISGAPTMVHW